MLTAYAYLTAVLQAVLGAEGSDLNVSWGTLLLILVILAIIVLALLALYFWRRR